MKKEQDNQLTDNLTKKMQSYIEQEQAHFFAKGQKDMVELHVDAVYAYDDNDTSKNLHMLSPLRGNRSVRIDPTINTRLCFGQDEAIF